MTKNFFTRSILAVVVGLVVLAGCEIETLPPPGPTPDPDFMVVFETTEFTVTRGTQSREVDVTILREGGFSAAVDVQADLQNFPGGVGAIQIGTGDSFTLQIDVQNTVTPGDYTLPFIAEGGGITKNYTIDLTVLPENSDTFTIGLDPSSLTIEPGNRASTTVNVSRDGFTGSIDLNVTDVPSGVSTNTTPPNASDQGSVSVIVGSGASSGTYTLTVEASGGGVNEARTLTLTIPSTGGGGSENARIQGSLETDNNLDNFTVTTISAARATLDTTTERPAYVPGELLVQYVGGDQLGTQAYRQQALDVQNSYGLRLLSASDGSYPDRVALPDGADVKALAAQLSQDPRVAFAEPNIYIYTQTVPNDPQNDQLWHMPVSGLPVAWSEQNSSDVVVAVIDTGIDVDHEDLQGVFVNGGYDFCASSDCGSRNSNPRPDANADTHGTHVAGTVAARGNNGRGVAGVLYGGAKIVPVKAFYYGSRATTTASALVESIRWAAGLSVSGVPSNPNPAEIITLSLGTSGDSTALENAVSAAQGEGALIIASSGNAGQNTLLAPASYPDVLAVGSVNSDFRRSCFSNFGSGLDIVAAGGDAKPSGVTCDQPVTNEALLSTIPNNNYGLEIGTSHATPIVTGVAALVWEQQNNPTAASVAQALRDSAYFDGGYMNASQYGAGVLRADVALGLLGPTRPGNRNVDVPITAESSDDSGVATDTLDLLLGTSGGFEITGLQAGSYTITADVSRSGNQLSGSATITLNEGQTRSISVVLDVPQP
ncbi:MAG: S8 family serine peptidase [Trueperaceae bacterium]|nr:S8 family serine peptidase [Trueperaceae bacterium]